MDLKLSATHRKGGDIIGQQLAPPEQLPLGRQAYQGRQLHAWRTSTYLGRRTRIRASFRN